MELRSTKDTDGRRKARRSRRMLRSSFQLPICSAMQRNAAQCSASANDTKRTHHHVPTSARSPVACDGFPDPNRSAQSKDEDAERTQDRFERFHSHPLRLPWCFRCSSSPSGAAVYSAPRRKYETNPTAKTAATSDRLISPRVAAASSRRLRCASEAPRGRGGYARGRLTGAALFSGSVENAKRSQCEAGVF
jgi:hypothetical protein